MREELTQTADRWLPYGVPKAKDKIRLFCFPHAGAGASAYFGWDTAIAPRIALYAVQLPGRESRFRESGFTNVAQLTDAIVTALRRYFDVPFAIFGHSVGALVGYEVARRLQQQGYVPQHVFVSGRRAPHLSNRSAPIHLLPDAPLINELRRLHGVPDGALANAEWRETAFPIIRADSALNDSYVWSNGTPLGSGITAIGGASVSLCAG